MHTEDKIVQVKDPDLLVGKKYVIRPTRAEMTTVFDYQRLLSRVETFVVRTSIGHHLIAVRSWPSRPSFSIRMKKQVIIFTQPNSSDLGSFLQPRYVNLPQLAEIFEMDVYGFDYSGYGYSTGTISEKSIYADIRAIYEYVRRAAPNKKIVLLGYSIGTTAVVDLASTHPEGLAGVILVAPFTSGLRLLGNQPKKEKTPFFDRFVSCDKVAAINVPVLICHGARDTVVPSEHGLELYEKLQKPVTPLVVHGADHQSILNGAYPQTFCRIHRFLKTETNVNLTQDEAREGFVMF
ncbi:phospholipase/carboxylesterase [Ancylostoma duodenale]|uniref:Phospholipase/carboxylesterase n=1 Tax=Ancylostoma duodenale TaxID=51022 RepID=A0A0C2DKB8_9BILA|nr:phospholipase/carboxylesterase [Ancylostoma duodenale]